MTKDSMSSYSTSTGAGMVAKAKAVRKSTKKRFELRKSIVVKQSKDPYSNVVLYNAKKEVRISS